MSRLLFIQASNPLLYSLCSLPFPDSCVAFRLHHRILSLLDLITLSEWGEQYKSCSFSSSTFLNFIHATLPFIILVLKSFTVEGESRETVMLELTTGECSFVFDSADKFLILFVIRVCTYGYCCFCRNTCKIIQNKVPLDPSHIDMCKNQHSVVTFSWSFTVLISIFMKAIS